MQVSGTWTISELAALAGAALAGDPVRVNGRVRELPNERLIRWYTTIGLLDPPLARRGRTALYGPRHLLQLVAVKRRQAAGLAIAQIQAELTGATDGMLRDIARLPEAIPPDAAAGVRDADNAEADGADAADAVATSTSVRRPRPRERFWADPPAADGPSRPPGRSGHVSALHTAAPSDATSDAAADAAADAAVEPAAPIAAPAAATATVVPGIRLTAGVTLLLDGGARSITAADLVAIEAAARPLLDELHRRGLHPPTESNTESNTDFNPDFTEPVPPTSPGRRST